MSFLQQPLDRRARDATWLRLTKGLWSVTRSGREHLEMEAAKSKNKKPTKATKKSLKSHKTTSEVKVEPTTTSPSTPTATKSDAVVLRPLLSRVRETKVWRGNFFDAGKAIPTVCWLGTGRKWIAVGTGSRIGTTT